LYLLAGALQFSFIACHENEPATMAREFFRQRQTQAARSAGDEYGMSVNIVSAKVAELVENSSTGQECSHAGRGAGNQRPGCDST
jgi:hypothetical protein